MGDGIYADTCTLDYTASAMEYRDWTTTSRPSASPAQAIPDSDPISIDLSPESSPTADSPNQSLRTDSNNISLRERNCRRTVLDLSRLRDTTPSSSWPSSAPSSPARTPLRVLSEVESENSDSARSSSSIFARSPIPSPQFQRPRLEPPVFGVRLPINRLLRLARGDSEPGNAPVVIPRNTLFVDEIDELLDNSSKSTYSAFRYSTLKRTGNSARTGKRAIDVQFSPDSKSIITEMPGRKTVGV